MRTKALLLSAAALAAGLITSEAQNVYSVNVVGYYNLSVPSGKFATLATQLPVNGTDSLINDTLTNGVPDGSALLLWNGSGFTTLTYFADFLTWADQDGNPATNTLVPGKAAFFLNGGGSTANITVSGQVPQGTNGTVVNNGFDFFSMPSSISTNIDSPSFGAFPATDGDAYLHWSVAQQKYDITYTYFADFTAWADQDGNQVFPTPAIGEGFFYLHSGGTSNWVWHFNVQ
jgi:hypothetical protein